VHPFVFPAIFSDERIQEFFHSWCDLREIVCTMPVYMEKDFVKDMSGVNHR
jgi:hypothetical protein